MASLQDALHRAGWTLVLERGVWWRCLIEDGDGSWTGESATEDGAVAAAFARMVPSARARRALMRAWEGEAELAASAAPALTAPAEPAPAGEPAVESEPPPQPDSPPEPEPAPEPALETAPTTPAAWRAPRMDRAQALAELQQQARDLELALTEAGGWAPSRLRMHFLLWVAEMRAVEAACAGDTTVHAAGYEIAKRVQREAFELWPGLVPALKIDAYPSDCAFMLYGEAEHPPLRHWGQVAEAARARIEEQERAAGRDEDGWADARALEPYPNAPDALLQQLCGRLSRLEQDWQGRGGMPTPLQWSQASLREELLDLARRARWLRGAVADVAGWGRLMGRLRQLADQRDVAPSDLAQVMAEDYRPARSWAKELGQDPEAKQRKRARRDLLRARPQAEASAGELLPWLLGAFEVLANPDLAAILRQNAAAVLAIGMGEMPDRRRRQRLEKLQGLLREGPDAKRVQAMDAEAAAAAAALAPAAEEAHAAERAVDPREDLRRSVLPRTRGRRLLFVSNRADPQLEAALRAALEPAHLDWCEGTDRTVAAAAARIANRTYDLVLCATGFMSHSNERTLRVACQGAGVPCVRVYKGRVVACLQALRRDLGGQLVDSIMEA